MRLLYCYVKFLDEKGEAASYRGLEKIEFNFSTVDRFSYDSLTNTLTRKERKCPLPDNFWRGDPSDTESTTNIYNINVVSGENGSGKTTAIHYLIDLLDGLHGAADPVIRDWDCMEKHGVAGNRTLLLLEKAGKQYLLDYTPSKFNRSRELQIQGFSEKRPKIFRCGNRRNRFGERQKRLVSFSAMLEKIKVIYLTNTLSQNDYERHAGERRNKRLRDCFVYDVSLGAAIGSDIAQFFPYEVYKQVCYVFDQNQSEARLAYKNRIPELILPHALRLRLRTELLEKVFPEAASLRQRGDNKGMLLLLGRLCVASFIENLNLLADSPYYPGLLSGFQPPSGGKQLQKFLEAPIAYALKQFERRYTIKPLKGHSNRITCIALLSDGRIVSSSSSEPLWVWDTDNGQCLHTLQVHSGRVECIAELPDGRVVSGSDNKNLLVWDTTTWRYLHPLVGHNNTVTCVAILPNGRVVSGSSDATLRVWDADTGRCLNKLKLSNWITCVAVLPNGRVVSGSSDATLLVSDTDFRQTLPMPKGHDARITCIAVLPDGRVVSGSSDATLRVWDANTKQCLNTLKGHSRGVTCVTVLLGRWIISGSDDKTLRMWDPETGQCLETLEGYSAGITSVTALPDGRIVSGLQSGEIIIHGLENVSEKTLTDVRAMADSCLDYVRFLSEKSDTLFSRFQKIDEKTYELSLEVLANMEADSLDCADGKGDDPETDAKELYHDLIFFLRKYVKTCKPTYTIDFDWGLSSGEENMLRLFSNLFHIFDQTDGGAVDTIYNSVSHPHRAIERTPCDTVLLFMDEADLTLHPEWQRRLISILTAFLPQIYPASCAKDIQLILSTHSPLILGDIPSENITYLPSKKKTAKDRKRSIPEETFGQNIHTILKESFFLENGTVGAFAAKKINLIAEQLKEIEKQASGEGPITRDLSEGMKEIQRNICIVAPGVLRARLEQLYRATEVAVSRRETASTETTLEKLLSDVQSLSKEQRRRLLEELNKERGAND